MPATTLDAVLSDFESLSAEDQRLFAELVRKRQIDSLRNEVAAQAQKDLRDQRAGKLKRESAKDLMKRIRSMSETDLD